MTPYRIQTEKLTQIFEMYLEIKKMTERMTRFLILPQQLSDEYLDEYERRKFQETSWKWLYRNGH